jgi:hypothetical protein
MSATTENEQFIRKAYQIADERAVNGWPACFNEDGTFTNESIGVPYRGHRKVGIPVKIFATVFPDCTGSVKLCKWWRSCRRAALEWNQHGTT